MRFLSRLCARVAAFLTGRPREPEMLGVIRTSEAAAAERRKQRPNTGVIIYEGGVSVAARDYVHLKKQGADSVEADIGSLDDVISAAPRLTFTLDYPFEKEFRSVVEGPLTLRRVLDAIRAGFDTMYEHTTQEDIPGMMNKKVSGPYGTAFHVMSDLHIESIALLEDDSLEIDIGS